jgi:hypothetical protein
MSGSCEQDNEPSDFVKGGEFLYQMNDCQFFKKDSGFSSFPGLCFIGRMWQVVTCFTASRLR